MSSISITNDPFLQMNTNTGLHVFAPSALRIYEIGLSQILDGDFFKKLKLLIEWKFKYEGGKVGDYSINDMFGKTLPNGFLYFLGSRFFGSIFSIGVNAVDTDAENTYTSLDELWCLLVGSGCSNSMALANLTILISDIFGILQEVPSKRINSVFRRQNLDLKTLAVVDAVEEYHTAEITELKDRYAKNFAERAFHDRQLCEYISYSLSTWYDSQGFPSLNSDGSMPIKLVSRVQWPSWVLPTLQSREQGSCAQCGRNFSRLHAEQHIDHIVPLSKGGCNDLLNLQLLCEQCNLEKSDNKKLVVSSIPEYLNWHKQQRMRRVKIKQDIELNRLSHSKKF